MLSLIIIISISTFKFEVLSYSKFQPFKVQTLFIFQFPFVLMAEDMVILSLSLSQDKFLFNI